MLTRAVRATAVLALALALAAIQPVDATATPSVQLRFLARWSATAPVGIESAGDGTDRLFIVEQGGRIRVVIAGALSDVPFLDVSNKVSAGGERGLLGLAFPAGFASKQYFYVNYTDLSGTTVIARYHVSASDPNVADPASEQVLLTIPQPFSNHNGGHLAFGPDGYLYIGSGDGGGGGDPLGNAQRGDTLLGKILRIDTEGAAVPYGVPTSNPFVGMPGYRSEIWALGLRNPWRFSFDRGTGSLWIADVGQGAREEIDYEPPGFAGGRNYGWNLYEGSIAYPPGSTPSSTVGLTFPVHEYDHTSGGRSVTGGFVYRGASQTGLAGLYIFSDFSLGKFWALDPADYSVQMVVDTDMRPSSFGQDEAGELYVADYTSGVVYQVLEAESTLMPVFRFYNFTNGSHFYTPSVEEADHVIATWPHVYTFEGVAYYTNPAKNTQPLYRFYSPRSGSHFYTASITEADHVIATWPDVFTYEGETYKVTPTQVAGSATVYRFYNFTNGSHFYTASAEEADHVIATWPHIYQFEGPAFWLMQ